MDCDARPKSHAFNLCQPLTSHMTAALQYASSYSIYPPAVSLKELTSAQALILSLFHSLLQEDTSLVVIFISLTDDLPQLKSSFISVWLRDDYTFSQKDVAKVFSFLAHLMTEGQLKVPQSILTVLLGLEEKYDIFNYCGKSGDTTAQYVLACLNPLVTRATQTSKEGFKDQGIQTKSTTVSLPTQTDVDDYSEEADESSLHSLHFEYSSTSTEDETSLSSEEESSRSTSPLPQPTEEVEERPPSRPTNSTSRVRAGMKLLSAVRKNNYNGASQALAAGASPDCRDRWDWTPLHLAAERGQCRMVSLLLTAGAKVNSTTVANNTALHYAASSGHFNCTLKLLNNGADPAAKNKWGVTPVHKALASRQHAIVQLIKSRIDAQTDTR